MQPASHLVLGEKREIHRAFLRLRLQKEGAMHVVALRTPYPFLTPVDLPFTRNHAIVFDQDAKRTPRVGLALQRQSCLTFHIIAPGLDFNKSTHDMET